jgi:endonuclease G
MEGEMKRIVLVCLLLLTIPTLTISAPLDGCREHIKYGAPSETGDLLCRLGYAISHNPDKRVANWVAYHLTAEKMNGIHPRSEDFRPDPDLSEDKRSKLSDYKGSGFHRGHMAPAASMKWSERAMSESFLLSNMAPQVGGFNSGIWKSLETKVRKWVTERDELYVVTGNTFESEIHAPLKGNVVVPSHCFKVIYDPVKVEVIAFILPNERGNPSSTLHTYIVTVDEVEQKTGLDFLNLIEDSVEDMIEGQAASTMW